MRALAGIAVVASGCFAPASSEPDAGRPDLAWWFGDPASGQDANADDPDPCGGSPGDCNLFQLGPIFGKPFPLPTDDPVDPNVDASGVARDKLGYLGLDGTRVGFDFGFVANATDWGRGTISRFNTRSRREAARYLTVTCGSTKSGSTASCDGVNGCCAIDDPGRFAARLANQPPPARQQVQLGENFPSRTAVDFNGDFWVANRAPGGQASITKISSDSTNCIDRNKNGKIDTSNDANGNGLIETDCNHDGLPDDIASVKGQPCANNGPQEFFGLDDECVLFTANVGAPGTDGRALSLGPGAHDFGPSDAWAGTSSDAILYRVDGTTGLTKDRATLPADCQPDGVAIDSSAIGWTAPAGPGPLCWLDTKQPGSNGMVRSPQSGPFSSRVIVLDRDQNLWLADRDAPGAWRYTPVRKNGKNDLANGFWTHVTDGGKAAGAGGAGAGITADSRTPNSYWAWLALDAGWLVAIPASQIPLPNGKDVTVDGSAFAAVRLAGFTPIAVDKDLDQTPWVVSRAPSAFIRVPVDANGKMTPPDLVSNAMGNDRCPAGDRCFLKDDPQSEPGCDAYSDFFGFGLRCFTRPKGFYTYVIHGCHGAFTEWRAITWSADVPLNTALTLKARAGDTARPDLTWGAWSPDFSTSSADLVAGTPLSPNGAPGASYLQVEIDIVTMDKNAAAKLKGFEVEWRCIPPI